MLTSHQKMVRLLNEKEFGESQKNIDEEKADSPSISVTTEWISKSDWDAQCKVTLHNLTNQSFDYLKIEFDITEGVPYHHSGIRFSQNGQRLTAYFEEWKLPLPANGQQDFIIGISYTDGSGASGTPPKNFTIDDHDISTGEDEEPPSMPESLQALDIKPYSISLTWMPSSDNIKVGGYFVYYSRTNNDVMVLREETIDPMITLSSLLSDHEYKIQVSAFDASGNESEKSEPLYVHTQEEPVEPEPDPEGEFLSLPFVDGLAWPTPDLPTLVGNAGTKGCFVGFVVGRDKKPCWGGHLTVYDSNTGAEEDGDARTSNYHKEFFSRYPDAILSIGGAAGLPPASDASLSPDDLCKMYSDIIDNYNLKGLDFDFEGGFLADYEALERHLTAVQKLLHQKPSLKLTYTLPVDGSPGLQGFNYYGKKFLTKVAAYGIKPFAIVCMVMEFGQGSSENLFEASKIALEGAYHFLRETFGDTNTSHVLRIDQWKQLIQDSSTRHALASNNSLTTYIPKNKLLSGVMKKHLSNNTLEHLAHFSYHSDAENLLAVMNQPDILNQLSSQEWCDLLSNNPLESEDISLLFNNPYVTDVLTKAFLTDIFDTQSLVTLWESADSNLFKALVQKGVLGSLIHKEKVWSYILDLSMNPENADLFETYPFLNQITKGSLSDDTLATLFSMNNIAFIMGQAFEQATPSLNAMTQKNLLSYKSLFSLCLTELFKDVPLNPETLHTLLKDLSLCKSLSQKGFFYDEHIEKLEYGAYKDVFQDLWPKNLIDKNLIHALKNSHFSDEEKTYLITKAHILKAQPQYLSEEEWCLYCSKLLSNRSQKAEKGWSSAEVWQHISACPMFGRNNNGKIFTLENQRDLNAYCQEKGMPIMSGWDMMRDIRMTPGQIGLPNHQPYDFCHEIATYGHENGHSAVNQNNKNTYKVSNSQTLPHVRKKMA